MTDEVICVYGDGGPLIVLQSAAVPQWQGAGDFENSLMNGGDIETDYDIICDTEGNSVIHHHHRDMLILWASEFGAKPFPSHLLNLSSDTLIFMACYAAEDMLEIADALRECIQQPPSRSLPFLMEDPSLRLQVGADNPDPSYLYPCQDIPMSPGRKRCDIYALATHTDRGEFVIIRPDLPEDV